MQPLLSCEEFLLALLWDSLQREAGKVGEQWKFRYSNIGLKIMQEISQIIILLSTDFYLLLGSLGHTHIYVFSAIKTTANVFQNEFLNS